MNERRKRACLVKSFYACSSITHTRDSQGQCYKEPRCAYITQRTLKEPGLHNWTVSVHTQDYCTYLQIPFTFMLDHLCGFICQIFYSTYTWRQVSRVQHRTLRQAASYRINLEQYGYILFSWKARFPAPLSRCACCNVTNFGVKRHAGEDEQIRKPSGHPLKLIKNKLYVGNLRLGGGNIQPWVSFINPPCLFITAASYTSSAIREQRTDTQHDAFFL